MLRKFGLIVGLLFASAVAQAQNNYVVIVTAATLSACSVPSFTGATSYTLCIYGSSTAPGLAASVNGGTFLAFNPTGGANPVLTVNGKAPDGSGNVTLTATTTSTTQSSTTSTTSIQ